MEEVLLTAEGFSEWYYSYVKESVVPFRNNYIKSKETEIMVNQSSVIHNYVGLPSVYDSKLVFHIRHILRILFKLAYQQKIGIYIYYTRLKIVNRNNDGNDNSNNNDCTHVRTYILHGYIP